MLFLHGRKECFESIDPLHYLLLGQAWQAVGSADQGTKLVEQAVAFVEERTASFAFSLFCQCQDALLLRVWEPGKSRRKRRLDRKEGQSSAAAVASPAAGDHPSKVRRHLCAMRIHFPSAFGNS